MIWGMKTYATLSIQLLYAQKKKTLKLYHEFNLETNVDKKEKMHKYDIICVSAHKQSGCEFHNKSDNDTWHSDTILIKIILL